MMDKCLNSSTPKEYEGKRKEDYYETEDPDTMCGIGNFRPKWLQTWATPRMYFILHSIIGVVSGSYYTYRVGVMSTLEKRYAFKSKTTGAIMALDEVTPVLFGALVGYFGSRTHRPRVLGLGTLMTALGCFISALPYFIYGPAKNFDGFNNVMSKNGSDLQLCDGSVRHEQCDVDDRPPTFTAVGMWMVAGFLKGFGTLTYYCIGFAYLDDNAKKTNSPMYFAISIVFRCFGPLLGFAMSSICLKYFENPLDDPGYGRDDPRWIGAWWIGFVLEGILLLFVTIPISIFPKILPGATRQVKRPGKDTRFSLSGMFDAFKRILLNPLLWAIILNDILSIYGTVGHHVMLPKYMEHQFRLSASEASLYSGVTGLVGVMIAVLLGGYLMWRFRPSLKFLLGAMMVSEIVGASGYLVLMIPKCEMLEMANFGIGNKGLILEGSCNMNCNCSRKSFTPVCGPDLKTIYFSPCYAGCEQNLNKTFFRNCSCISESIYANETIENYATETMENYATEEFCMSEGCWFQALAYIIAWPTIQFLVSILRVMHKLMLLRCTQSQDKSLALALVEATTGTLGLVPYLLVFGALVDTACLVWESSCKETGNCWFYDTDKFNNILHGSSALFSFLSVGSMGIIYCMRGRFNNFYDDDFFYEEVDIKPATENSMEISNTK